jgi:lipoprotein-anchoring transpeptidase ErfK/SrfK
VQFIKQICVIIVLGALGYAAYMTLTGAPPAESPVDMATANSPARVEMPGGGGFGPSTVAPSGPPGGAAPRFNTPGAGPSPARAAGADHDHHHDHNHAHPSPGPNAGTATILGVRTDTPGEGYPNTNVQPAPFDGGVATPLASARPAGGMSAPGGLTPAGGLAPSGAVSAGGIQTTSADLPSIPTPPVGAGGLGRNPPAPGTPTSGTATPGTATSAAGNERLSFEQIQGLLDARKPVAALDAASNWFDDPALPPDVDREVMRLLDTLAGEVIYSRNHLLEKPHTVGQGESLSMIAAKYGVTAELLMKINGIADPLYLPPGTQLKVIKGPFNALVDKSRRRLTLFLDGMYAGSFPIGLGRDRPIADELFSVRGKTIDPPYQGPDLMMSSEDPNNPLGERWIELGGGLGIHGTNDPQNYLSDGGRGIIRLSPRDAEDVFDMITVGSQVVIRP